MAPLLDSSLRTFPAYCAPEFEGADPSPSHRRWIAFALPLTAASLLAVGAATAASFATPGAPVLRPLPLSRPAAAALPPLRTTATAEIPTAEVVERKHEPGGVVTPGADPFEKVEVEFPPPLTGLQRLQRSLHFYRRSLPVLWSYQVLKGQLKAQEDSISEDEVQRRWDHTHEMGSRVIARVINELKGFYVKSGQLIATRVDLFPEQYTSKLSQLQDSVEPMPFSLVRAVVEQELLGGGSLWELFEAFDTEPLGSASVAQVHKATLIGGEVVAVKVQRPNIEPKMMGDIGNLKTISKQLRSQLPYDYYVIFSELETQLINEFDFIHEARSMSQVVDHLSHDALTGDPVRPYVKVPRPIPGLVSKRAMVMEYIEGKTLAQLAEEAQAGIGPKRSKAEETLFARMLLKALTAAFGRMIFETGFFHGDPHPGNVMVQPNGDVSLIDWGQTKQISRRLKMNLARIITGLATRPDKLGDKEFALFGQLVTEIGVKMTPDATNVTCAALAIWLFDSTPDLPGGYSTNELSEKAPVRKVASFPQELVFVGRSTVLIRGIATALGVDWSLAEEWAPFAAEVLRPQTGVARRASQTVVRFRSVVAMFGLAFVTLGRWLLRKTFGQLPECVRQPFVRLAINGALAWMKVWHKIGHFLGSGSRARRAKNFQLA